MKQEKIDELQALLDAGTPGEWISERSRFDEFPVIRDSRRQAIALMDSGGCAFSYEMMKANSDLTADLHNLAPALLEAARENLRLREERENWRVSSVCREKQLRIEELERETAKLREALEKIAGMNETGGVLNVSMTMLATETIAKAALGKETA